MVKKINVVTNPDDLKMLRTKCVPVLSITDDIISLVNDLAETCVSNEHCVGLSSNQIWTDRIEPPPAIFVIRMEVGIMPFINPTLIKSFNKQVIIREGCMSVPGKFCEIRRPKHIVINFMDKEANKMEAQHVQYVLARIWLHEFDHLQGKLITDYE